MFKKWEEPKILIPATKLDYTKCRHIVGKLMESTFSVDDIKLITEIKSANIRPMRILQLCSSAL